ncbi:MAG TPA: tetratricopeptide repeat protein [Kofleriaceae bacterium]|nr:tetratricopeptide repeat protein [Kofleriaceae bacterium]
MQTKPEEPLEPWRSELRRGLERLRDGEFEAAQAHFARAHRLAPDRAEACFALGRERLRSGDVEQAESLLRDAWRRDPSLLSAAAFLARCIGLERGDLDAARAVLREAQEVHGQVAPLCVVEAELYLEEDRGDEARAAAEQALADDTAGDGAREAARALLARVHNQEGIARASTGDAEAALFAFRRAAELDPEWSAPLCNLGAAFEIVGRAERAQSSYERALSVDPDNATARFNLARLLRHRGLVSAALAVLERSAASEPDSVFEPTELTALRAEIYIEEGEVERATALLSEAVATAPTYPGGWVDLAGGWQAAGDRERAEDCLRIALELDPGHVGAKLRLADLLVRDGRYIEAGQLACSAQSADPDGAETIRRGHPRLQPDRR